MAINTTEYSGFSNCINLREDCWLAKARHTIDNNLDSSTRNKYHHENCNSEEDHDTRVCLNTNPQEEINNLQYSEVESDTSYHINIDLDKNCTKDLCNWQFDKTNKSSLQTEDLKGVEQGPDTLKNALKNTPTLSQDTSERTEILSDVVGGESEDSDSSSFKSIEC